MRSAQEDDAAPKYSRSKSFSVPAFVMVPGESGRSDFRLGLTPVTRKQYERFLAESEAPQPPWWNDPRFARGTQPVVGVTWHEALAYCEWLSRATRERWRLPTEAEWEHAASGGLESPRTAWGDRVPDGEIPPGALDAPWDAGRGTPNGYGLLDMGTLVHEWCLDAVPPSSPGGPERRASRGGSWRHAIRWTSPAARSSLPPAYRYSDYGFRVLGEADGRGGGA
jgi:formylglycine-generating enzyme required for sulfatase activity